MKSTTHGVELDLDDDRIAHAAAETAYTSIPPDGRVGEIPVTVRLPVFVEANGARIELGHVTTDIVIAVDTERPPPGPVRAPDPEAVDALDAERAARAQQRAASDAGQSAPVVESTLRDITPYECAQESAAVLRAAAKMLPEHGAQATVIANGWLSLGLAMATHAPLNKPAAEGDR